MKTFERISRSIFANLAGETAMKVLKEDLRRQASEIYETIVEELEI